MRDVHDELRARLRESAGAYRPDRTRILARVERGMADGERAAGPSPRPAALGWWRVAAATAAVAGVLAVGGHTVASAVRGAETDERTVAVTPSRPDPPASPGGGTEDGPLRSDGSVDPHSNEFWAQSNVTVTASRRLTALRVVLRVRQTGGVTPTGSWRSAPEDDFTVSVVEEGGFLVHTWELKPGRTVWPGEWVFAGQYDHDRGGRDAGDDTYAVEARADGEELGVTGGFARTRT
ncbi:hypothetical protein [Streptomyces beigongshangae]|uniref:hypothetical protein n=1 Tax=Streptomyces beigongshangae TaxID=2841597 RepID=UPI001C85F695|nr:hypothetical protein [Streptomyces sp. REN17]